MKLSPNLNYQFYKIDIFLHSAAYFFVSLSSNFFKHFFFQSNQFKTALYIIR